MYKIKGISLMVILTIMIPTRILAQEKEKRVFNNEFDIGEYTPLYVSYYGNLIAYPGIKLGFDWNFRMKEKVKENKRRVKTIMKLFLATPSIAFYYHKASHRSLLISTDVTWRRYCKGKKEWNSKKWFYSEVSLGIGYQRRFNSGETWEANSDGTVSNIGSTSRGYFAPSISLGIGKRYLINEEIPIASVIKLNTDFLTGYNAGVVPELSFELGVRVTLNWGIKRGKVNKTIVDKSNKVKR